MSNEDLPDWLPEGWIAGWKRTKVGKVDRFYRSPISGSTFFSKEEVLNYLNKVGVGALPPPPSSDSGDNSPKVVEQEKLPAWLPRGWIMEIKTRKTGMKAGTKYKCYFDPCSGCRFYSKLEVLRYIKGRQGQTFTLKRKANLDSPYNEDAAARRCLIVSPTPSSSDNIDENIAGFPFEELNSQNSDHHTPQDSDLSLGAVRDINKSGDGDVQVEDQGTFEVDQGCQPNISSKKPSEQNQEMMLAKTKAAGMFSGSVSETNSKQSDINTLDKLHLKIVEPENKMRLQLKQGGLLEPTVSNEQCIEKIEVRRIMRNNASNCAIPTPANVEKCEPEKISCGRQVDLNNSIRETRSSRRGSSSEVSAKRETRSSHLGLSSEVSAKRETRSSHLGLSSEVSAKRETRSSHLGSSSEVSAKRETRSSHLGSSNEVSSKHEKRSGHRGQSNEVSAKHETRGSHRGPSNEVDAKCETQSSHRGSSREVSTKRETRSSHRGSFSEVSAKRETRSSHRDSSSEVSTKRETRSSHRGSSGEVNAKCETQGSRRGSSSEASAKCETRTRHQQSSSRVNNIKSFSSPPRTSKRLAGVEPGVTSDIDVTFRCRSHKKTIIKQKTVLSDAEPSNMVVDSGEDCIDLKKPDNPQIPYDVAQDGCVETSGKNPMEEETVATKETDKKKKKKKKKKKNDSSLGSVPCIEFAETTVERERSGVTKTDNNEKRESPVASSPKRGGGMETDNQKKVTSVAETDIQKKESSLASPFGGEWPDPCIEFAFKTLTGDIPILDYFPEQVLTTMTSTNTKSSPGQNAGCHTGKEQAGWRNVV